VKLLVLFCGDDLLIPSCAVWELVQDFSQHSHSLWLFQVITCSSIGSSNGLHPKKSQLILIFAMRVAEKLPCPYGDSLESEHMRASQFLRYRTLRQQQN